MLPRARRLYLPTPLDTVFAMYHAPEPDVTAGTPVLICSPWGWDEIASYRSRRSWAEHLAANGHPTLRFDLPATGDSAGAPADPERVEAWIGAVVAAAEWLRATAAGSRLAVLGLGLGGLMAGAATARGAPIDELVLWAAPTRGRAFTREMRAFARMRDAADEIEDVPSALPDGWLESGGFVLAESTIADLADIDLRDADLQRLERVLLLGRDGLEPDVELRERLVSQSIDVSQGSGVGWGDMVVHPERSKPPRATFEAVGAWLAEGADRAVGPLAPGPPAAAQDELELDVEGIGVRERPIEIGLDSGTVFGVLAERADRTADLCLVFLNAGAVRRVGSNRMWVEASRRLAGRGVACLRLDVEGLGDADGDAARYEHVGAFYAPPIGDQVLQVLDALTRLGLGPRFGLVGLCAGGYWSFQLAGRDPRVRLAAIVNAGALTWRSNLPTEREARKLERALSWRWWRRLLRGDISSARLRVFLAALWRRAIQVVGLGGASRVPQDGMPDLPVEAVLDGLRCSETRVAMAFATGEPLLREIESGGIAASLRELPGVELTTVRGADHTMRPIHAQRCVHELLDRVALASHRS